jgi:isocitrate lyase
VELLFVALTVARANGGGDKTGMRILLVPAAAVPLLSGCVVGTVAKTAVDVATLPVKAVSAGVDAATTSQKEADEKRGRELRKQDEERGKQARLAEERCRKGRPLPTDQCMQAISR